MDSFNWSFSGSNDRIEFNDAAVSSYWDPSTCWGFQPINTFQDDGIPPPSLASYVTSPQTGCSDQSKRLDRDYVEANFFSGSIFDYINQVLMQDDLDYKTCMIQDSTLHATEQSLYEILNEKYPSSPNQPLSHEETSSSSEGSSTNCCGNSTCCCINANNSVESGLIGDIRKYKPSHVCNPVNWTEEGKTILKNENCGMLDFENGFAPPVTTGWVLKGKDPPEKDDGGNLLETLTRGRKTLHHGENDLDDGRSNKQLAISADDSVIHEMFDKVLSLCSKNGSDALPTEQKDESQQNELVSGSICEIALSKKGVKKRQAVDMRTLLLRCMQSVADSDHQNANKLLKQIRLRSSPLGDGTQRLAHYFANGLEARLLGAGRSKDKALADKSTADADGMKVYKLYLSTIPFLGTSYFFTAQAIMELVEKADTVHIIHFGILCGVQWPPLIQCLSTRPGGSPKLRVTGIDFPQAGFRPAARVEETGRRLAKYCEMFNVPFEYNGVVAEKWETVSIDDLKIKKDEVLVVNCLYQFMYLLDDTILEHSPRDAVLNLIKRINPDLFLHGVVNGAYNSPFFVSRFRQALFYFSTLFDMFDANVPRENQVRISFEKNIWGKEILNIIACEGLERVERPETYKQWQMRTMRAGFRQLPLNQKIIKEIKDKVNSWYHKDFFVDEASEWLLKGWRGRVIFALSCWKPM
ncbi:hypothetical protein NMG60_11014575 [Bertholletia excelsa]